MVAGMFGLMAAYAAGSSLHLRTSVIALVLVVAVCAALVCLAIRHYRQRRPQSQESADDNKKKDDDTMMQEYLMLVGILGASVTYFTGLKPPGGMWTMDEGGGNGGHAAGNPVLYDMSRRRYNAFFYSNSTAFMASIVVMGLLLSRMIWQRQRDHHLPLWPMHTAMFLGMSALLVAYAAGSARDACTSWTVIVLLVPIVAFVMCLFAFLKKKQEGKGDKKQEAEGALNDQVEVTIEHLQ